MNIVQVYIIYVKNSVCPISIMRNAERSICRSHDFSFLKKYMILLYGNRCRVEFARCRIEYGSTAEPLTVANKLLI